MFTLLLGLVTVYGGTSHALDVQLEATEPHQQVTSGSGDEAEPAPESEPESVSAPEPESEPEPSPLPAQEILREYESRRLTVRTTSSIDAHMLRIGLKAPRWKVVEGDGRALDAPLFADRVGDKEGADRIVRIRRNYMIAGAGLGLAGATLLVASLIDLSGDASRDRWPDRPLWLMGAGVALGIAGPGLQLSTLLREQSPAYYYDREEAESLVDEHREALRESFGLSPDETRHLDQ